MLTFFIIQLCQAFDYVLFVGFFACVEWLVSVHFCLCSLLHQGSCWFTEKKQLKYICHRLFCCCVKPKAISFEQGKRLLKLLTWIQGVHEIPFQEVYYWLVLLILNSLLRFQKAFSLIEQKCLIFQKEGVVYWLKGFDFPQGIRCWRCDRLETRVRFGVG